MEEKPWKRNHGGVILEGIWRQKHPGVTQELRRSSPGGTQAAPRSHPGGAPRHPESTQRHQGARQETREVCEVKWTKTTEFSSRNGVSDHFRVDGSDLTLTKSAA